ncbi:hypothetical protein MASR2M29_15360 [Spirochaetota bacterium]
MILLNESFAAANERKGTEVCKQITRALVENGIEVFSETHLYTYTAAFLGYEALQFLRAERLDAYALSACYFLKPAKNM